MDTNIIGQSSTGQTTNANRFTALVSAGSPFAASATAGASNVMPITGTLRNFYIQCDAGPGAGITRTYTIVKSTDNGATFNATNITVSLTGTGTGTGISSGNDTIHTDNFNAGDIYSLQTSATTTTTNTGTMRWTLLATSTPNTSMLIAASTAFNATANSTVQSVHSTNTDNTGTVNNVEMIMPTSGTLKNARVVQNGTSGTAGSGKNYIYTLYRSTGTGSSSPTAITMTVSETATTGSDLSNSITVAASDRIYWRCDPTNAPSARQIQISLEFDPDTNGESVQMFASSQNMTTTAPRFQAINANGNVSFSSTETPRQALTQAAVFKKLYLYVPTAPGVVASWNFQLDAKGTAGSPSVTISGATAPATGNDTSNVMSTNVADTVSMSITPTLTPAASQAEWSIVSYIQPPSSAPSMLALLGAG